MTLVATAARASGSSSGGTTQLATLTLGSAGALDIASIPQTATSLLVVGEIRSAVANSSVDVYVRLNNDSGANYDSVYLLGSGGTAGSVQILAGTDGVLIAKATGSTAALAAAAGLVIFEIPLYTGTTWNKNVISRSVVQRDATASGMQSYFNGGQWRSTAAVNRILLRDVTGTNFAAGSSLTVYGIS